MAAEIAGLLGAAAISSAAQLAINHANIANQNKLNDISVNLANTQHQREVADLKLAGLNPILSAQGAGSAVPSLQQANQESPFDGSTGKELAKYMSNLYKNQVAQTKADALQSYEKAKLAKEDIKASIAERKILEEQLRREKLQSDMHVAHADDLDEAFKWDLRNSAFASRGSAIHQTAKNLADFGYMEPLINDYVPDVSNKDHRFWNLWQRYRNAEDAEGYRQNIPHAVLEDIGSVIHGAKELRDTLSPRRTYNYNIRQNYYRRSR